jgi:hypothetical protein
MKKFFSFVFLFLLLLFSVAVVAEEEVKTTFSFETSFEEEDLLKLGKKFALNAGLGTVAYSYIENGERKTEYLPRITAYPTFKMEPISVGLELNYLVADKDTKKKLNETGKNPLIFKYLQYDKSPIYVRIGNLDHITLGHGFIMNNYSTTSTYKSAVYTNKDKGVRAKYTPEEFGVDVVSTQTHVYGIRAYTKVLDKITVGATYVTDGDKTEDVTIYGLDAGMPIFSKMDAYIDWAKIENFGQGFAIGTKANLTEKISWINEYRNMEKDFAPGFFDAHYETNVILAKEENSKVTDSLKDLKNNNGFLSQLNIDLIQQLKASVSYEDYDESEPRLIGIAKFAFPSPGLPGDVKGYISYEQKNLREKGISPKYGIVKGELATPVSKNLDMVVNYTQVYQPEKITSVNYSFRFKF